MHELVPMMKARTTKYSDANENEDIFNAPSWYVLVALSAVNCTWSKDLTKQTQLMTSIVTRTDEAFVVFVIETNKKKWSKNFQEDEDDADEEETTRFASDIGLQKYEDFTTLVENARAAAWKDEWDREIQNNLKEHYFKAKKMAAKSVKKRKIGRNYDAFVDEF